MNRRITAAVVATGITAAGIGTAVAQTASTYPDHDDNTVTICLNGSSVEVDPGALPSLDEPYTLGECPTGTTVATTVPPVDTTDTTDTTATTATTATTTTAPGPAPTTAPPMPTTTAVTPGARPVPGTPRYTG